MLSEFVVFDFEWKIKEPHDIYLACFVDNKGRTGIYHRDDFSSQADFLKAINSHLMRYFISSAYAGTFEGSDLSTLLENCTRYGVPCFVEKRSSYRDDDEATYWVKGREHIDAHKIYTKKLVRNYVYNSKYRTGKLNDVAKGILGRGKYGGITGATAENASKEEQIKYCLEDTKLVLDLLTYNNSEIMKLMEVFSQLTGLSFVKCCNVEVGTYWGNILQNEGADDSYSGLYRVPPTPKGQKKKEKAFKGGNVVEPKVGVYHNMKVVDVTSLYPSMIIKENISFDTINCACCADDETARIPEFVAELCRNVPNFPSPAWICKKEKGIFSGKQTGFKEKRVAEKKAGNAVMSDGLKILLNSGFGVFGNEYFRYSDLRVASLIPAFGQYAQARMIEGSPKFNLPTVYGDTDSLFFDDEKNVGDINGFLDYCKNDIGIDVEFEKEFKICVITGKKHYFGLTTKGKPIVKGMEGKKQDRPKFVRDTFDQFVKDVCAEVDPRPNLRKAIDRLFADEIPVEDLKFSVLLTKNPDDYDGNVVQRRLGTVLRLRRNDLLEFYKTKSGDSLDSKNVDYYQVKDALIEVVRDTCDLLKLDISDLEADPKQCSLAHFL